MNIEKDFIKDIIKFTRYFNLSASLIDKLNSLSSESSKRVVEDQCHEIKPQFVFDTIHKVRLNRELKISFYNDDCCILNSICFYTKSIKKSEDDSLIYFNINEKQLEELIKFYNECMNIKLEDLAYKIRLMNMIKGTKLYGNILENILRLNSTSRIILINILYNLAIISREDYLNLLFNLKPDIDYGEIIFKITEEINSHTQSTFYGVFNMILYNKLENLGNNIRVTKKISFFRDFLYICQIPSISKLFNLDKAGVMDNLRIFVEKVLYCTCELEYEKSNDFYALIAQVIKESEFDHLIMN